MICDNCGMEYDPDDAIEEFNNFFEGELDYDEVIESDICAECAIRIAQDPLLEISGKAVWSVLNGIREFIF